MGAFIGGSCEANSKTAGRLVAHFSVTVDSSRIFSLMSEDGMTAEPTGDDDVFRFR